MASVCRVDDLEHGEAQRFDIEGHRIAVVRIGDVFHAVSRSVQSRETIRFPREWSGPKNARSNARNIFPSSI